MRDDMRARLEGSLGPGAVVEDGTPPGGGGDGGAGDGGAGERLTLHPPSEEAVAAAVRLCREAKTPLTPIGGGTLMEVGGPPAAEAVRLSLSRLNALVEHDDANLTATAQAGVTVAELQAALRRRGQFAAVDTADPERATIGGIVAVNLNGYRSTAYRRLRDLVIGMRVVTGTGEIVKAGGKVVKNVAGYDMCKLFVGSLGTLGVITETTARLEPVPEAEATLLLGFNGREGGADGVEAALEAAGAPVISRLLPTAVALLNRAAAHSVIGEGRPVVLVRLGGFSSVIERQERELRAMAASETRRLDAGDHDATWDRLHSMGWDGSASLIRVMLSRADLAEAWQVLGQAAGFGYIAAADVLSGTIWLAPGVEEFRRAADASASVAERAGGHLLIARVPPGAPPASAAERWRPLPPALPLMRALKQSFDPDGILNPGRFLV